MKEKLVSVSVIGVSGTERLKGAQGVGKSLICNRFVRGSFDDFHTEHCSILSQTDFCASPVINNDHWLYWGERNIQFEDGTTAQIRVIEQTEFVDDESFEPIAGPSTAESYCKRAVHLRLESRDKLMYIQKEQLGLEAEFPQQVLPEGKFIVDGFVFVFDVSYVDGRTFDQQIENATNILVNCLKTKRPLCFVFSKMDSEAGGKKEFIKLLQKKEFRGIQFTTIECSSVKNVNVDEIFISLTQQILKLKSRLKILPYHEAFQLVNLHAQEVRSNYARLLSTMIPIDEWPIHRKSYARLIEEFGLETHEDYAQLVRLFGKSTARTMYSQHLSNARERWMKIKLRSLLPQLHHVFSSLLNRSKINSLHWEEANQQIHEHPLFDEFFQPLGSLGRQLEPFTNDPLHNTSDRLLQTDKRIPAEILLMNEAQTCYESYQGLIELEQRKERMEENFEILLQECGQVTPGRPMHEVYIFLSDSSSFDCLSSNQAAHIYDRYQSELVKRAEIDFAECLLEHIHLFLENTRNRNRILQNDVSYSMTGHELNTIRNALQEDIRYRKLSRLWELRDGMILSFASFVSHPAPQSCPSLGKCADVSISDQMSSFLTSSEDISVDGISAVQFSTHADFLLHMFILCGDPFRIDSVLASVLTAPAVKPIAPFDFFHSNTLPLDVTLPEIPTSIRIDLLISSYHSWITSARRCPSPTQGHVLVYSARRAASWAHARAAVFRIIENDAPSASGNTILIVAVTEVAGSSNSQETDLLTEGSELAQSIGALFITISKDSATIQGQVSYIDFFTKIHAMIPRLSPTCNLYEEKNSYAYADISEFCGATENTKDESSNELCRRLPISHDQASPVPRRRDLIVAPLATPEMVDIASEYSLVQDADEHIHTTLDYAETKRNGGQNKAHCFNYGKHLTPKKIPSGQSIFATVNSSTYLDKDDSQEMVDGGVHLRRSSKGTRAPLPRSNADQISFSALDSGPTSSTSRTGFQNDLPDTYSIRNKRISRQNFLGGRSITMDVINREAIAKARTLADVKKNSTPLRHSISAESLNAMHEQIKTVKKKSTADIGFVRKVTSSFRFRQKDERELVVPSESTKQEKQSFHGARSVPHSPRWGRKNEVSRGKVTHSFPWLPSRSPKRSDKSRANEKDKEQSTTDAIRSIDHLGKGGVPEFVSRCVEYIEQEGGLSMEGLYRIPGNQSQLAEVEKQFKIMAQPDLSHIELPLNVVGTALKNFFSKLEQPIIPHCVGDQLLDGLFEENEEQTISSMRSALSNLSVSNYLTLSYLFTHLKRVSEATVTNMDIKNLSKIWWPTLFRPQFASFDQMNAGTAKFQKTAETLMKFSNQILPDISTIGNTI